MMLEDDELHYQPKPIEDSDKVAREIAYDDTIQTNRTTKGISNV